MTELRVTIKNTSEPGGTFLTPVWLGFHDGSFDLSIPARRLRRG
jgi:hypothetical protein